MVELTNSDQLYYTGVHCNTLHPTWNDSCQVKQTGQYLAVTVLPSDHRSPVGQMVVMDKSNQMITVKIFDQQLDCPPEFVGWKEGLCSVTHESLSV